MALNLRTINPELHAKLKARAALTGKTIEQYCLDVLSEFDSEHERYSKPAPVVIDNALTPKVVRQQVQRLKSEASEPRNVYVPPRFRG